MKILLIILFMWVTAVQAQTKGYLRYDSVIIMKNGGNGELIIENGTRGVTGGVLTNTGNGRTSFVTPAMTGAGWLLTGNSGTTAGTNFIGTTDSVDLVIKTKNLERFRVNARGALGVGTGTDYGTSGYLLKSNGATTAPAWVDPASYLATIYNSDGAVNSDRFVDATTSGVESLYFGKLAEFNTMQWFANRFELNGSGSTRVLGTDSLMLAGNIIHLLDTSISGSATNGYVWTLVDANDGEGTWKAATGGGTPGGSDTQVQFNDGGSFGGDAGLTFNKTSNNLTAGSVTASNLTSGRVPIAGASGLLGDDADFVFDGAGKVLGLGAPTINTWTNTSAAIQSGNNSIFFGQGTDFWLSGNARFNSGWFYKANGKSGNIGINEDMVMLRTAATGVADAALTWVVPIKADGTTGAIGGNISQTSGDYTGATLIANTTRVGIGGPVYIGDITTAPNASAALDVTSTTKGVLLPRMTATQGSAITGVNGLMIYVTDTNGTFTSVGFWGYEAGAWIKL